MSAGPISKELFERALAVLPGGVSSPVRAFGAVGGSPPVIRSGNGATVEDEDGNSYTDFVCSWGPLILGHAHPQVVQAVTEATSKGTSFGAPCKGEIELAELITGWYPGLEKMRFVSSGTEATMSAIRLARGYTKRDTIIKFSGCYHGHADHLLVDAGSGLATFGNPSSAGVPEAFAKRTVVLPLDDEERVRKVFEEIGEEIAAVIVEPVPANNGLLLQRPEFLQCLRDETAKTGTLLIFDEVISGFRLGPAGAAGHYGITPDLATFGKIIGGGLPVGAFGGRAEIMNCLAPLGPVYQAGTLSGNPVAMAAGKAALTTLEREKTWARLEELGRYLEGALGTVLQNAPVPCKLVRIGSIFWISFQEGDPPRSSAGIAEGAAEVYGRMFNFLLDSGISMAPSAYEVGFLSAAHTEGDIDTLVAAIVSFFESEG
jgi:glutamate-1-semialdehyde 2,1-aminomutase